MLNLSTSSTSATCSPRSHVALTLALVLLSAAALSAQPAPNASLPAPESALIGEEVTLELGFSNLSATDTDVGYGPFLDVVLPINGADGNAGLDTPDGLSFVSANYLDTAVARTLLTFPDDGAGTGCVDHPVATSAPGTPRQVCGTAGDQLLVLQLPFGSFVPDQPEASVALKLEVSELADLGFSLPIHFRAGFRFGADPIDNPCCDPSLVSSTSSDSSTWPSTPVLPALFAVRKEYLGPESETATGPNFPRQYRIALDLADGQSLTQIDVTDLLPDSLAYLRLVSTSPSATTLDEPTIGAPANAPDNDLSVRFASLTGSSSDTDATVTLEFFVPRTDANANPILSATTGDDVPAENNVTVTSNWTPVDTRDPSGTGNVAFNGSGPEHTLSQQSIAVQKSFALVSDTGSSGNTPGDTLRYTLTMQVSDYFVLSDLVLTDVLSDGQSFDATFTPTLSVLEHAAPSTGDFDPSNFTVDADKTPLSSAPNTGRTTIEFRLSNELVTRSLDGVLLGGCVPTAGTGGPAPACSSFDGGPTIATITFQAKIDENFSDDFPSGDPSVDQGDRFSNSVIVDSVLHDVADLQITAETEDDDSSASGTLAFGVLSKSIYAINGSTTLPDPLEILPGDVVTYRLRYVMPSADFENLVLSDFLPLPVFDATEVTQFDDTTSGIPAAGHLQFGPTDSLRSRLSALPAWSVTGPANELTVDYGDFDEAASTAATIDLLFTVTASDRPFADDLLLTNQVHLEQASTNGSSKVADAIVQFRLRQPVLRFSKGAVASDNGAAQFSPAAVGPNLAGTVSSDALESTPVGSDVADVDAGDTITFALVLENRGGSGAFDIVVTDALPDGFALPGGGLNLVARRGDGTVLTTTGLSGTPSSADLFAEGLEVSDPDALGACRAYDPTSGSNVIVITYDLQITEAGAVPEAVLANGAEVTQYAGLDGSGSSENHINDDSGLAADADTTIASPGALKSISLTSEAHTPETDPNRPLAIGETLLYRVVLDVPEGTMPGASMVDQVSAALEILSVDSVVGTSGLATSHAGGFNGVRNDAVISGDGLTVTLPFDQLTNTDRNNAQPETITVDYTVRVRQSAGVVNGATASNQVTWSWTGGQLTTSAPTALVVEPALQITKSASPQSGDAGDQVTFTVEISHTGSSATDAFDLVLTDLFADPDLALVDGTVVTSSGSITKGNGGEGTVEVVWDSLPFGSSATITFDGLLLNSVLAGDILVNEASLVFDSLPGEVGERGYGPLTDSATVTVGQPSLVKTVHATSETHTGTNEYDNLVTDLALGEEVTFRITSTLPEGVTAQALIIDNLPATAQGVLEAISASVIEVGTNLTAQNASPTPVLSDISLGDGLDDRVEFDFGQVTNDPDGSETPADRIVVEVVARVADVNANRFNRRLTNTALFDFDGSIQPSATVDVEIVEPKLEIDKSAPASSGDAGDRITYTIEVDHRGVSSSEAFDLEVTDTLPDGLVFAGNLQSTGTAAPATLEHDSGVITATWDSLPQGSVARFTFDADVEIGVNPGDALDNTADLIWDSLPSDADPPGERSQSRDDDHPFMVTEPGVEKTIFSTSEVSTGTAQNGPETDLTIGEEVVYRILVTLPEGTVANATVVDQLPKDDAVLEAISSRVVAVGTQLSGAGLPTVGTAGVLTDTVGDGDGYPDVVTWDLGTVVNTPDGATDNLDQIEFEVTARVVDSVDNVGTDDDASNLATLTHDDGTASDSALADIVEPLLELDKTASAVLVDAGDTVTFTLTLEHTANSNADAFSLEVVDAIPAAGFDWSGDGATSSTCDGFTVDSGSLPTVTFTASTLALGDGSCEITYDLDVKATVQPGQSYDNTAALQYDSQTPFAAGLTRRRTDNAMETVTIVAPGLVKITDASSLTDTGDSQYDPANVDLAIGEQITYELTVIFPEGITEDAVVVDRMPADPAVGLIEVIGASVQSVGTKLSITGSATPVLADLQEVDGINDTVTFDFGQVTNNPDGFNTPDDRITITVTGQLVNLPANAAGDELINTAELTYATGGPHSDTAAIDVVEPTLVLGKQMGPVATQVVPIQLTIENTGSAPAYDVHLEDVLSNTDFDLASYGNASVPTGFLLETNDEGSQLRVTLRSDPGGSSPDNSIEPGETITASFTMDALTGANAPDQIVNVADETGATSLPGADPQEREQPDRQVQDTLGLPILDLGKAATILVDADASSTASPGDTLRYTLSIPNTGLGAATNVVLTDTPDALGALVVGSVTADSGGVVTTGNTAGDTEVRVDFASIAATSTATVTFDVQLPPSVASGIVQMVNQASLTSSELDPLVSDDPSTGPVDDATIVPIDATPDMLLTKTDNGAGSGPGGAIYYQLGFDNIGNQNATGVVITETVPANTIYDASINANGWDCADGSTAGTACNLVLPGGFAGAVGQSNQVTFAVRVVNPLPSGVSTITNSASIVDDGSNGVDPVPANNSAQDSTPVSAAPILTLSKDDGGATATFGSTVAYTLTYGNSGNQDATGVTLSETVPVGSTFNATASLPSVWSCSDGATAGTSCEIDLGALASGANGAATFAVDLTADAPNGVALSNTASIVDDGTNATGLPVGSNASDTTPVRAPEITKTLLSSATSPVGTEALFRITVTIPEGANVAGVTVTDSLPAGLLALRQDSVIVDPALTVGGTTVPVIGADQFSWNLGTLTNSDVNTGTDEQIVFEIATQIRNDASSIRGAALTNQVQLVYGSQTRDASASVTVAEPQLTILKEFEPRRAGGNEVVDVRLRVFHDGASDASAHDVVISDLLDGDLSYVGNVNVVNGPTPVVDVTALPDLRFSTAELATAFHSGNAWEFTFELQTAPTVTLAQIIDNEAIVTWTSVSGDPGLADGGDSGSGERTGDPSDPGGALNVYRANDAAQLNNGVLYTFEDLRNDPDRNNDFDYNDFVIRVDIDETVDTDGNWTRIELWVEALARGAAFVHDPFIDLGLQGPTNYTRTYYDRAGVALFSDQGSSNDNYLGDVRLFFESWYALPQWGGPGFFSWAANTDPQQLAAQRISGASTHLVIEVGDPASNPRVADDPVTAHLNETVNHLLGPWIAVRDTGEDIYQRWRLRNSTQDLVTGELYGLSTPLLGFPLDQATTFATTWEWPVERVPIWNAYPDFVNYIFTGQTAFQNWHEGPVQGNVWPVDGARNYTNDNPVLPPSTRGGLPTGSFTFEDSLGGPVSSSPAIGDLDGDGLPEVVVGSFVNTMVVHDNDGTSRQIIDPMPTSQAVSVSSVTLADLDGDGDDEILRGYDDGVLRTFDGDGTPGVTFTVGGTIKGTPAVADVQGDALPEVFILSGDTKLYGFTAAGAALSGFPVDVGGAEDVSNNYVILPSPVVAQLDGSGPPEIVAVSNLGEVHVFDASGNELPGFPVDLGREVLSTPAVGDVSGGRGVQIVVADAQGGVTVLTVAGTQEWQSSRALGGPSSPVLAQLDGTGGLEVVVGSFDGKVYAFDSQGNDVPGWPVTTSSAVQSSPAAVDLDGDGADEIFVGSFDTNLYGFDSDGSALMTSGGVSFPVDVGAVVFSSPSVADLDGDGHAEVVVGSYDRQLYAVEAAANLRPFDQPWPQFRGSGGNGGVGETVSVPLSDLQITVDDGQPTLPAGATNTWTVTVSNAGPDPVSAASVSDTLPTLSNVSWTCATSTGTCSAPSGTGALALTVDLPVGEQATIQITGTTDPGATGDIVFAATAGVPLGTIDLSLADNSASDTTTLITTGDVEVTLSNPTGTYTAEEQLIHELTVSNVGPSHLTAVTVTSNIPASVMGLIWSCSGSSGGVCPLGGAGNVNSNVDLPAGSSIQFVIEGTVEAGTEDPIVASASATIGAPAVDPNLGNNDDTATSDPLAAFDAPRVDSVSDLATQTAFATCRAFTGNAPGGLRVDFSEQMASVSGGAPGDFDNPSNYLVVAAGSNADLQTSSCTTVAGDDVIVPILAALGTSGNSAVELALDGPVAGQLQPGLHRLLICEDLTDLDDLPLDGDGDGIGGDPFSFDFRVDPGNAIDDGAFDCDLGDWTESSADPAEVSHDAAVDVAGSTNSGSIRIQDLTGGTEYAAHRCVPLGGGTGLSWQIESRFSAGGGVEADLVVSCELFSAPACAGSSLGSSQRELTLTDTAGAWQLFDGAFADDPAATSARCSVSIEPVSGLGWTAWVDDARFSRRLFSTGFESGSTVAWSTTIQ